MCERLSTAVRRATRALPLAALLLFVAARAAGAVLTSPPTVDVPESVVRGQTIVATAVPYDSSAVAAGFRFNSKTRSDLTFGMPRADVPFETAFSTGDVAPGRYALEGWTIDGAGSASNEGLGEVEVLPLPVMPDFRVSPLMIADSRWLVGFQIRGPKKARIYAWGRSFPNMHGVVRLRAHQARLADGTTFLRLRRKMLIPLAGRSGLIVESAPLSSYKRHGVTVRARVRQGFLYRNRHTRDTVFKSPQRQNLCTSHYGVLKNGAFPPLASCVVAGA